MAKDGEVAPSFQPLLGWSRSIFWGAYGDQVADPAIEAANLYAKMVEVNGERNLVRHLPSEKQVADWVEKAKQLERALFY